MCCHVSHGSGSTSLLKMSSILSRVPWLSKGHRPQV
jgi:hypothetical protein